MAQDKVGEGLKLCGQISIACKRAQALELTLKRAHIGVLEERNWVLGENRDGVQLDGGAHT